MAERLFENLAEFSQWRPSIRTVGTIRGGKIGSESRQDFRFVELPKLLASFATPLIDPTVLNASSSLELLSETGLNKHRVWRNLNATLFSAWTQAFAVCLVIAGAGTGVAGEPFLPADDSVVLETLPDFLKGGRKKFVEIQEQLRENPSDESLVQQAAALFIDAGEANSDPRFFGIARKILDPWWKRESVPGPILLLRARIKERDQLYNDAIVDLIKLNSQQPDDGRALISLARLYAMQGQYGQARDAAKQLEEIAGTVAYLICLIPIDVVTGNTKDALAAIEMISPDIESQHQFAITWLSITRANIAEIIGNTDQAERFYQAGLVNDPDHLDLKLAYADFLINQKRCETVGDLLKDHGDRNAVLLRVAIAAKVTGDEVVASQYTEKLTERLEAVRQRGDHPDRRISARCYLDLTNQPELALREALANWEVRRELEDSRLVLRAAVAAESPGDVREVKRFLRVARTEDVISEQLISQLESQ
ncbi:hypothetical protein LF1_27060 [Rubripirellula obstinata]|uniref:Tetratricopeptide repeat protein n=1 Tax=Rubripirellula obstinata TaxID=406547 RepID=A0A5B1CG46_9BACT|nr:hypothetical protein [Rubripirellula obstinata]KAA1260167.1 hypothetical protein LF1_27060 [Rubripirellula obstinata]